MKKRAGLRRRILSTAALFCVLFAAGPPTSAADTYAPEAWTDCTPAQGAGGIGGGDYDNGGNLYVSCGSAAIRVYSPTGTRLADIPHGAGTVQDVSPSADGSRLYLAMGSGVPRRMTRQAGGGYVLDPLATWSLAKYPMPGVSLPGDLSDPYGNYIATDDAGNVFVADGTNVNHGLHGSDEQNHNRILKYTAAGAFVTSFGRKVSGSWALGDFHGGIHGIAVSGDGNTVLAADGNNSRIQRFTQAGGTYTATSAFGSTAATNPDREGFCDERMASPYDVSLDESGAIYVLNTTCRQILKFNGTGTTLTTEADWAGGALPHAFASSKNGRRIYVQQSQQLVRRTDLQPEDPDPDPVAPCNRWASPTGSDAALGTEAEPYRSVKHLIQQLTAGQTGCLESGVRFNEPAAGGFIVNSSNGTIASPVTIRSEDPADPAEVHAQALFNENADNIVVRNIDFVGSPGSPKGYMIFLSGADGVQFKYNELSSPLHQCIGAGAVNEAQPIADQPQNASNGFVLKGNTIHHCGADVTLTGADSGVHGLYLQHTIGAVVSHNYIYENLNRGIQLYPASDDSVIEHNLLDRNGSNLNFSHDVSLFADYLSERNVARNNLITNSDLRHLTDPANWPDADQAQIYGSGGGFPARPHNVEPTFSNVVTGNCIYQANPAHNFGGGGYAENGNTFADPGYENAAAGDYDLVPGGPCEGKGPQLQASSGPPNGTVIDDGPVGDSEMDFANFEFSSPGDVVTGFECRLDPVGAGGWAACTSPKSYNGLALGPHRFEVRALNAAGADPTPAVREWTVVEPEEPPATGGPGTGGTVTGGTIGTIGTPSPLPTGLRASALKKCKKLKKARRKACKKQAQKLPL